MDHNQGNEIIQQAFWLLMTAVGAYIGHSVNTLNARIAVVIQQLSEHGRRIEDLEDSHEKIALIKGAKGG